MREKFSEYLLGELMRAYLMARLGKGMEMGEHRFEMNAIENVMKLRDEIMNRTYEPENYVAFVQKKPVIREVFAPAFSDKVVHQFLYNQVYAWWNNHMIYDSYSCRGGKGVWFGIRRADKMMRSVSRNYTEEAWVLKFDLLGYFVSLDRRKLLSRVEFGLNRQYPEGGEMYRTLRFLWRKVLLDDPVDGVKKISPEEDFWLIPRGKSLFYQEYGKGIVVGNLSSQLVSNIYLDQLDRYIKYELKYKYYGRYCDDFFIMVKKDELEKAKRDVGKIERYLREELDVKLHPNKRYIQKIDKGLPFLGVMIYPRRIVPGRRVVLNFRNAVKRVIAGELDPDVVQSYVAYMENLNGRNVMMRIFQEHGWWEDDV